MRIMCASVTVGLCGMTASTLGQVADTALSSMAVVPPHRQAAQTVPLPTPGSQDGMLYTNGPLSIGATTKSGAAAPAGTTWSEVQNDASSTTIANTTAGFRALGTTDRIADDFVVPTGQTWTITGLRFFGYQTGSTTTSTFTGLTVRILNGAPPTGTVVFGDMTTNRLTSTGFSSIYRTFNTVVPPTCGGAPTAAATNRPIMELNADGLNIVLTAGTYWLDWSYTGSGVSGPWCPLTTVLDTRAANPAANALQSVNLGVTYVAVADAGQGCGPTPVAQDYPFIITGDSSGGCYPDCNLSGNLTIADFGCFQAAFAGGNMYADCNQSGTLTIADFGCFQAAFAAGCP